MNVVLFIILLIGGITFLAAALFLTRLTWRSDIAPYGLYSPFFQIALHPERFAKPEMLQLIRFLNDVGLALLTGAAAVVVLDIVTATYHQ